MKKKNNRDRRIRRDKYFGKKTIATGAITIGIAAILVLTTNPSGAPSATLATSTIEVSQLTHLTSNSEYDRNPSICYNGSDYWLFYTKGDDTSTSGVRGVSYDPDSDSYVVYYKTASALTGLKGALETKLTLSETTRPINFDQRVVSATYFKGDIYAFVSSGQSGTNRGLYYYRYNGTWSGPAVLINNATARGGHVNVVSDSNYVYIVWESSDASSDCYTWDGITLSSKIDISTDNQPKITLTGSTLYVVSIEDGTGDIEVYSAATSASPSFSSHSTAILGAGFYDPCIFSDGTDLYAVTAPYIGGNDQQYLIQSHYSGGGWSTVRNVSLGGYGGTYWWDYWPIGYYDGGDLYVFFTTESSSSSYSDAEIAYIEMDWDLDNDHYFYIQNAIDEASSGAAINMAAGTHAEGPQLHVDKDVTVTGQGCGVTVLTPTSNTGTSGDARGWWLVDDGVEFNLDNMTLDGTGYKIYQAIRHKGSGTIDHVCFTEIKYDESGPYYSGVAIAAFGSTGAVNTMNCAFTEIGRLGILQWINGTIKGNTYTGKGDGDWLDYFADTELSTVTIEDNSISNCTGVASSDGSTSAGILVTTFYGPGANVALTNNTIHDCTDGVAVGYDDNDTSTLTLTENTIYNNDYGINMIGHCHADIDDTNTFSGNTHGHYHMTHIVGTAGYWGNIQDAYDNATSTTIHIYPGIYTETITISNGHTDLVIHGDDSERPVINGGIYFTNTDVINGITIENLYLKGEAASSTIIRANSDGVKNDFIMDNCIVDGENVSGRNGMTGNKFGENLTFTNNEFKDVYGWAVMDIDSSSDYGIGHWGANGLPFTTVTWADNYVHHCDGSIALRGNDTYKTTFVAVYNNTWEDIGGHDASDQHWAAVEINHAVAADFYGNTIDDVTLGMWGEGQGVQFWDVDTLDMHDNTITNCEQAGIFIFGGSLGGNYGGPWTVPGGSIYHNNFGGNGYGIEMESACTGGPLDAECNWWGCSCGPSHTSNPSGSGDNLSDNIDFIPWLYAPYPSGGCIGQPGVEYDWNYWTNPPHMWAIPDGNVGIGTDNPEAKLDVNGSMRVQGDTEPYLFFVNASQDVIGIGTSVFESGFMVTVQGNASSNNKGMYVKTADNTYESIVGQCHHQYRPAGFVLENRYPASANFPKGVMMRFKGMDTNGVMQEYLAFIAEYVTRTAGAIDGDCWIRPVKNNVANWAFRFTHDGKLLIKDGATANTIPNAHLDVRGDAVFNEEGDNYDFRIEGDNEQNLFCVDASTDRVGIGTKEPAGLFHVHRDGGVSNQTVDQQQTNYNIGYLGTDCWQSFTAGKSGALTRIDWYQDGDYSRDFTMKVYSGEGIGGTLLVTQSFSSSLNGWRTVDFTSPALLTSGQQYTFRVTGNDTWNVTADISNPYAGGHCYFNLYGELSNVDVAFKTYVSDYIPTIDFTVADSGNVGIGTTNPQHELDVEGVVEAHAFNTGDIFFQKDGTQLWRMFEDEKGLYVENLETGKIYTFVLEDTETNPMAFKHLETINIPGLALITMLGFIGAIGITVLLLQRRRRNH